MLLGGKFVHCYPVGRPTFLLFSKYLMPSSCRHRMGQRDLGGIPRPVPARFWLPLDHNHWLPKEKVA